MLTRQESRRKTHFYTLMSMNNVNFLAKSLLCAYLQTKEVFTLTFMASLFSTMLGTEKWLYRLNELRSAERIADYVGPTYQY